MTDNATEYNDWVKPGEGKQNWHEDYYDFLRDLDVKVIRSGPLGDRPESAPSGAWWYAEDAERFSQFRNGAWRDRSTLWGGYELYVDEEPDDEDGTIVILTE